MSLTAEELREQFWREFPRDRVGIERIETHVIPSRGRTGRWVIDEFALTYRSLRRSGLLTFAPRLQPSLVADLSRRLDAAARDSLGHRFEQKPVHAVAVEVASRPLLEACRRADLAVFDLRGTVDLSAEGVLIELLGSRQVERKPRHGPFTAVGTRVIRALLSTTSEPLPVRALALRVHSSYSSVWTVLAGLKEAGLVELRRGTGPRVTDPRALLREWCERGPPPVREGFFCPDTTATALHRGWSALTESGAGALFTYRSGLTDEEVITSGMPHGVRSNASTDLIVRAFGLRPKTPLNFFVVRDAAFSPGPGVETGRTLKVGPVVATPQLIFDLHHAGERERVQADALARAWVAGLPARAL